MSACIVFFVGVAIVLLLVAAGFGIAASLKHARQSDESFCADHLTSPEDLVRTHTLQRVRRFNPLAREEWELRTAADDGADDGVIVAKFVNELDFDPKYEFLTPDGEGAFVKTGARMERDVYAEYDGLYTQFDAVWDDGVEGHVKFKLPLHEADLRIGDAFFESVENRYSRRQATAKLTFRGAVHGSEEGETDSLQAAIVRYNFGYKKYKICTGTGREVSRERSEFYSRIFAAAGIAFDVTIAAESSAAAAANAASSSSDDVGNSWKDKNNAYRRY